MNKIFYTFIIISLICCDAFSVNVRSTKAKKLKDRTSTFYYDVDLDGWNSTKSIYVNGIPLGTDSGSLSFNTTNLPITGGIVNTAQGISSIASPTFAGLTINGNIGVAGTVDGINISSFVGLFDNLNGIIYRDNDTESFTIIEPDNWDLAYQHKLTVDALNGLIKCNGTGTYSTITDNSIAWDGLVTWKNGLDDNDGILTVTGGVYNRIPNNSANWDYVYEQSGSFLTGESDTLQAVASRGNSTSYGLEADSFTGEIIATNHTLKLPVDNDTGTATGSAWSAVVNSTSQTMSGNSYYDGTNNGNWFGDTGTGSTSRALSMGAYYDGTNSGDRFNGKIDYAHITDDQISNNDLSTIYNMTNNQSAFYSVSYTPSSNQLLKGSIIYND